MERVMGVEPTCQPWEGRILPMNYTRVGNGIIADRLANINTFFAVQEAFFFAPAAFRVLPAASSAPAR